MTGYHSDCLVISVWVYKAFHFLCGWWMIIAYSTTFGSVGSLHDSIGFELSILCIHCRGCTFVFVLSLCEQKLFLPVPLTLAYNVILDYWNMELVVYAIVLAQ